MLRDKYFLWLNPVRKSATIVLFGYYDWYMTHIAGQPEICGNEVVWN